MPAISGEGDWGLLLGISAAEFSVHRFSADSAGLHHARLFARNVLEEWGLSSCVDDAVIVVGELIANAARHALEPENRDGSAATAWLGLVRRQQAVICAVADPSPCAPEPQQPERLSESGRGLHIVEAISSSWGCSPPQHSGKMVWARVLAAPDL
ncbi:ATP-binding protein [Streptomyces sp. me109]|uniref:ATP-binding protein n=1 Tax=Streptomyces sp. me109 TaxID=1827853 RepID=UPI0011CE0F3E|nr:ATP-binding protein [Streptomyces sp. me109]TXS54853.1 ATP-binding protein [Streptomyces sp. me109]